MKKELVVKCPQCKKSFKYYSSEFRPFCADKCKMIDMGHDIYYYENNEGGHGGDSTYKQSAKSNAMLFSYLLMKLKSTKYLIS